MLRSITAIALCVWACSATAAPAVAPDDEFGRFLNERGLLDRLDQVGAEVSGKAAQAADRASEMVLSAMAFLGVPYQRGGESPEGFDCSGFVKAMVQQTLGRILPRRADEQAAATLRIERQELQPGDLVFFNTMRRAFSHVGIYVGDGKFIHSPKPGAQVRVEDMRVSYWARRFDGARRVTAGDAPTQ